MSILWSVGLTGPLQAEDPDSSVLPTTESNYAMQLLPCPAFINFRLPIFKKKRKKKEVPAVPSVLLHPVLTLITQHGVGMTGADNQPPAQPR